MVVISLGGSIVAPDDVDVAFVRALRERIGHYLAEDDTRRMILIVGGGAPARRYQAALGEINVDRKKDEAPEDSDARDWIGIMATRLNAELVRHVLARWCTDPVVTDPTAAFTFSGRVLIAAGWKPGFSTDFDAVMLAERFAADTVINLSNIEKVYTADPKKDPDARPLDSVSWTQFREMVGDGWIPGANLPFDPVATRKAAEMSLRVIAAGGKDLDNLDQILRDRPFHGTTIGPH